MVPSAPATRLGAASPDDASPKCKFWEEVMEIVTMGKVMVQAKIENLADICLARKGVLEEDRVRAIEIADALVDTGATLLSVPRKLVEQLGLRRNRTRTARTSAGPVQFGFFDAVRLTVQQRDCVVEVCEVPDDCPVLIGQLPLEMLDFVVDTPGQKLIGNPEHGGEQMIELY
jgi:predicted aspartyl protease